MPGRLENMQVLEARRSLKTSWLDHLLQPGLSKAWEARGGYTDKVCEQAIKKELIKTRKDILGINKEINRLAADIVEETR